MRTVTLVFMVLALLGLGAAPAFAQSAEDADLFNKGRQQDDPAKSKDKEKSDDDEDDEDDLDDRVFYSGFGVERVSADYDNLGAATNLVGVLGFRIPTAEWFGIEIDLGQTIIPGEYSDSQSGPCLPTCPPPSGSEAYDAGGDEFAMQALGLSVALKSRGRFYVSGKYGYRYLITSNDTLNENDRSSNGLALGLGYRWGKGLSGVELGYKQVGEDVDAIGLTFYARPSRR